MQKLIILDLGSQTTQLIGRRVRELDTFCEVLPYNKYPEDDRDIIGLILSGDQDAVEDPEALQSTLSHFCSCIPVLRIAAGEQPTVEELRPFVLETCGSAQDIVLEIDASAGGCFLCLVAIVQYVVREGSIAGVAHIAGDIRTREEKFAALRRICLYGLAQMHRDTTNGVRLLAFLLAHDNIHEGIWLK